MTEPNKITGANAGGPRQLAIRTRWAARVAQFWRSVALRAPERRVARSASPDLSDRALIRAAEQNRSSRYVWKR
jgi:hypothetical protein